MGEPILQDPLQALSHAFFELTGEKLYELFHFIVRNPYVSRAIRQVRYIFYILSHISFDEQSYLRPQQPPESVFTKH